VAAKIRATSPDIGPIIPPVARSFWFVAGLRGIAHIVV
jgi:hypothetical protein